MVFTVSPAKPRALPDENRLVYIARLNPTGHGLRFPGGGDFPFRRGHFRSGSRSGPWWGDPPRTLETVPGLLWGFCGRRGEPFGRRFSGREGSGDGPWEPPTDRRPRPSRTASGRALRKFPSLGRRLQREDRP